MRGESRTVPGCEGGASRHPHGVIGGLASRDLALLQTLPGLVELPLAVLKSSQTAGCADPDGATSSRGQAGDLLKRQAVLFGKNFDAALTHHHQPEVVVGDHPDPPGRVLDDASSPKIAERRLL